MGKKFLIAGFDDLDKDELRENMEVYVYTAVFLAQELLAARGEDPNNEESLLKEYFKKANEWIKERKRGK